MAVPRFAFVVNPIAGRRRAESLARHLADTLSAAGAEATVRVTERADDAIRLAAEAARACDVVVAAGGDGTASHVARGLVGSEAALFVLPVGTGNDFAFAQGVRLGDVTAERLLAGSASRIDMGRVRWAEGEALVLNGLGIGYDARVAQAAPRRKNLGAFAYAAAAVDAWRTTAQIPTASVHIALDDVSFYEGAMLMAAVGNTDRQGGGFRFTPASDASDGRLDLCLAEPIALKSAIAIAFRSRLGRHTRHPAVRIAPFERMTLTSDQPLPIHADGEVIADGALQVEVEVVPSALRVWTL